jgi:hypothetical protein
MAHRKDSCVLPQAAVLTDIEGKQVKISGRIEMYKGKPEIRINAASQLEIGLIGFAPGSPRDSRRRPSSSD